MEHDMLCYFCSAEIGSQDRIFRTDSCPACGKDLHACVQCQFYDPHAHNQCREPKAEFQANRERANFCEYFQPSEAGRAVKKRPDTSTKAKKALENLFKDSPKDS